MATTEVDIVNMALGHLGDAATVSAINPSDGSAQADLASRFYEQTRDWLLERFSWKFALRRSTLALLSIEIGGWDYVYAEPNNVLRILSVLPTGYIKDTEGVDFETETQDDGTGVILTNATLATCRYIVKVTDVGRFSPGFVETLSWALASMLAGPIVKGETGRAESIRCLQASQIAFSMATGLSANQAKFTLEHIPESIRARNSVLPTGDASYSIPGW